MSDSPQSARADRVLVLEADPALRERLREALVREGFELECHAGAAQGMHAFRAHPADVVLLGSDAEAADPADVCASLRSLPEGRCTPLVLLVQDAGGVELRRCLQAGASDFLQVPAEERRVVERVEVALRCRRTADALERARLDVERLQRAAGLGLWELDPDSGRISCSAQAASLLGLDEAPAPPGLDALLARLPADERAELREWLAGVAAGRPSAPLEHALASDDPHPPRVRQEADLLTGPQGPRVVCLVRRLPHAGSANGDGCEPGARVEVPGIASDASGREHLLGRVESALEASDPRARHLALLYIDLHQIRSLSGVLAHQASRRLMVEVGRRLREGVRAYDHLAQLGCQPGDVSLARIGGDEFCMLLPHLREEGDAVHVGRRVLELLGEPFTIQGQEVFVTVSVGVAGHAGGPADAEELLKRAQTAAYCARQQGRNSVLTYSPAMDAKAFERLTLETGLRRALEREELLVHYQPRVEIGTSRMIGAEALIRWRHPDLGLISPGQFIPLAEETGLIVPIGEWVLQQACEQNKVWQAAGLPPVRVSVNLSAVQFRQPDLFETVAGVLERTQLEPRFLELELTESLLMQNPELAVQTLQRLSGHGIHLSIDDFGTGYSSLSYLKRFPIDSLKIDQSFIRELTTNPDDAAIATSIILMGRSLKLRVVAEGVETRSQLSFLRVMQCHEAQGYLFSPPVPAAEAERLLRQGGSLLEAA